MIQRLLLLAFAVSKAKDCHADCTVYHSRGTMAVHLLRGVLAEAVRLELMVDSN